MNINPDITAKLIRSIVLHIGLRAIPEDIVYFSSQLNNQFDWFKQLNEDRQLILIDMCFRGFREFCTLEKLITALSQQDYKQAAQEIIDSKWGNIQPYRAQQLANAMLNGIYEI